MSDLVGNPEDRFSHNEAPMIEGAVGIYLSHVMGKLILDIHATFTIWGPVVQSIFSLMTSLRQLVKYMQTTLSNTLLFFVGKCEHLLQCIKKAYL